jgi:hypothetical protein
MKNFHLPLPEETYQLLRAKDARSKRPATALAQEAICAWLRVAKFATGAAGTQWDQDSAIESAANDQLMSGTVDNP